MEDRGGGELQNLIDSGASWLDRWFVDVRRWEPGVVDEKRVTWVRLFGLPCLEWGVLLFHRVAVWYFYSNR